MLKQKRINKNFTQKDLSTASGLSQSYISKLESERFIHSPTIKQIILLAKSLDISPYELCFWFIDKELSQTIPDPDKGKRRLKKTFVITKK